MRAYDILTLDFRLNHVAVIGDSYTTGTNEGGLGPRSWTARAWQILAQGGERIAADVAAEGKAGYGVPGDHGSIFEDLTARAVKPDDALVVFFGSRNDQGIDPGLLAGKVHEARSIGASLCAVREAAGDRTAVADRRCARVGAADSRRAQRSARAGERRSSTRSATAGSSTGPT